MFQPSSGRNVGSRKELSGQKPFLSKTGYKGVAKFVIIVPNMNK
jgi:hypothetical protein